MKKWKPAVPMVYSKKIFFLYWLLAGFLALSLSSNAEAASPYIGNLAVMNSKEGLMINATLINVFPRKLGEAIQSGVPLTLQYDIELKERRAFFPDENIVKRVIKKEVIFSSLEKEYRLSTILGNSKKTVIYKKLRKVRDDMIQLRNIHVIPSQYLKPNQEYYIRVKGRMSAKNFWFPFNYILFFVDFLNFETSWVESTTLVINRFPVIESGVP